MSPPFLSYPKRRHFLTLLALLLVGSVLIYKFGIDDNLLFMGGMGIITIWLLREINVVFGRMCIRIIYTCYAYGMLVVLVRALFSEGFGSLGVELLGFLLLIPSTILAIVDLGTMGKKQHLGTITFSHYIALATVLSIPIFLTIDTLGYM